MRKRGFLCFISAILFLLPSFLWAGTATVQWQANPETDLKEYKVYRGTASRTYSAPLPIGKVTSYTFSNLAEGTTHYFSVTAVDSSGNESGFSVEASKFVTASVSDTQKPQVTITLPTTSGSYTSSTSSITLGGTATDSGGVTQVTWTKSTGGSGTATGTSNWSIPGISLVSGSNAITVTAKDAAGNSGTDTITVSYSAPSAGDAQAPSVSINSPSGSGSYTTSSSRVNLAGSASDNVGVTQVSWSSTSGYSGTAYGTGSWSVRRIKLSSGENTITVTLRMQPGTRVQPWSL